MLHPACGGKLPLLFLPTPGGLRVRNPAPGVCSCIQRSRFQSVRHAPTRTPGVSLRTEQLSSRHLSRRSFSVQHGRSVFSQLAGSPLPLSQQAARRLAMDGQPPLDSTKNALSESMPICDRTEAEWTCFFFKDISFKGEGHCHQRCPPLLFLRRSVVEGASSRNGAQW